MTLASVAALVAVLLLLGIVWTKLSTHPLDPLALFCYLFGFFYGFRDVLITFGWDTPSPDELFIPGQVSPALTRMSLGLTLFLLAFIAGYLTFQGAGPGLSGLVHSVWAPPSLRRQIRLTAFLTVVATLVSADLLAKYGSIAGVVQAGKVTHSLAGSYELRIFPSVGAVAAAALFIALRQQRRTLGVRRPVREILAFAAALLNASYVLLWGSRSVVAAVIAVFIAGQWLVGRRGSGALPGSAVPFEASRPRLARVVTLLAVLLVAVYGLRVIRDTITFPGHVASSIAGQSALRKISVAANATHFDASLLAVRDFPAVYPFRSTADFRLAAEGVVPRALWSGKPANVLPGAAFRKLYEPWTDNGWPLGAFGDWYLAFGFFGVAVGGLLSGVLYTGLMAAWRRAALTPFSVASLLCVVLFVAPTGIEAMTVARWAQWALPLLLCGWYLCRPARVAYGSLAREVETT